MTTQATTPKRRVATYPHMTEQQLLDCVVDLAHVHRWLVFHALPLRRADGSWRTATQGDKGFPDLVLARIEPLDALLRYITGKAAKPFPQLKFVELKSDRGRVSPEQQAWLDALYPYSCVWRPADWHSGKIAEALR